MASTAEVTTKPLARPVAPAIVRRTAPHRVRDLDRTGWLVAGAIVVLLALPWVASYWRYHDIGYTIADDNALIGLRVHDVFSTHPPMVGQPSTAGWYSGEAAPSHPGPIEFYLLAVPMKLFGSDAGSLIGAELFSLGAVLTAVWVVFRRAGPAVALAAAVVFGGIAWSQGLAVLSDILSSNVGGIPLLGLAVLAWAVMDGDIRLLPLAAFFFSFVAEQHLAMLALGIGGGIWVALGAARYAVRWHWDRRPRRVAVHEEHWVRWRWSAWLARLVDVGDRPKERPKPWIVSAVVVTFLAWLPPLVEAVVHKGGNLWRMGTFSGNHHAKLGLVNGLSEALRAVGLPPLLLRTNLVGVDMHRPLGPRATVVGVAMVVALVAVVVRFWRRNTPLALLSLTTLVVAAVGAINMAQAPMAPESLFRLNFYRWMFVGSALTWLTVGWALGVLIIERSSLTNVGSLPPVKPAVRRRVLGLGAVAAVGIVSVLTRVSSGPMPTGALEYRTDRQVAAAVQPAVARYGTILLLDRKNAATTASVSMAPFALAPALAQKLVVAGHHVVIPSTKVGGYGASRRLGRKHYDVAILVDSSPEPPKGDSGKTSAPYRLQRRSQKSRQRVGQTGSRETARVESERGANAPATQR